MRTAHSVDAVCRAHDSSYKSRAQTRPCTDTMRLVIAMLAGASRDPWRAACAGPATPAARRLIALRRPRRALPGPLETVDSLPALSVSSVWSVNSTGLIEKGGERGKTDAHRPVHRTGRPDRWLRGWADRDGRGRPDDAGARHHLRRPAAGRRLERPRRLAAHEAAPSARD